MGIFGREKQEKQEGEARQERGRLEKVGEERGWVISDISVV